MRVYIVSYDIPYEGGDILGVFSTPEKAMEYARVKMEKAKREQDPLDFEVFGWEVDTALDRWFDDAEKIGVKMLLEKGYK